MTDQELERRLAELPKALSGWQFGAEQRAAVLSRLSGSPASRGAGAGGGARPWLRFLPAAGGAVAAVLIAVLIWPSAPEAPGPEMGVYGTGEQEPAGLQITGLTAGQAPAAQPAEPAPEADAGPDTPVSGPAATELRATALVVELPEPQPKAARSGAGVQGYAANDSLEQAVFRGGPIFVMPGYERVAAAFSADGSLAVLVGQQGSAYAYWVVDEAGEVIAFDQLAEFVDVAWAGAGELIFNGDLTVELP